MTDAPDLDSQLRPLLGVSAIARATGHSRMCVYRALLRLGVEPIVSVPHRLFDPAVVETLKARMRKPRAPQPPANG